MGTPVLYQLIEVRFRIWSITTYSFQMFGVNMFFFFLRNLHFYSDARHLLMLKYFF